MTAPTTYAYFGPAGTFTEAALRSIDLPPDARVEPYPTVPAALAAVRRGAAEFAMVPIENSVEGAVPATLDDLAGGEPLVIVREVLLPVRFALIAAARTSVAGIRAVGTHPHGEAQCRRWLAEHLPGAEFVATASTAGAVEQLARGGATFDAAIAAPIAAWTYGLEVLADGIADNDGAITRFVLLSRPVAPPPPTGADRTTLVLYIRHDHPGALMQILEELAVREVNMTTIVSRPTGQRLGHYLFFVDCDGHVADAPVGEALMGLRRVCAEVRYVGSYPRAGSPAALAQRAAADAGFRAADAWLARLRAQGNSS